MQLKTAEKMNKFWNILKKNAKKIIYTSKLRFYARDFLNILRFGIKAPRSAQLFFLNPSVVRYSLSEKTLPRRLTGMVKDGDWDLNVCPIHENIRVRICRNHFVEGKTWKEAGAIELMEKSLQESEMVDNCSSMNDVYKRYENLDMLYANLKKGGKFKTRKELDKRNFRERGGIYIHIGREGEPILQAGSHRFAIALYVGLKHIPAQLGVVHRKAINNGLFKKTLNF